MLKVSEELKRIYRMNMLPKGTKADIQGRIVFGDLGLYIGNDRIVKDTFRLTEMISDGGDLDFGSTNASVVEFTVADVPEDLNGQRFTITQTVNGTYTVPLGTFTVDSCKRQDDLRFKDIVAYDDMQKFNRNVAEWYNGLTFPITVQGLRESLCQYCGVAYESVSLVNDNIRIYKTLDTNELNGKEVLRAIAELNGAFAHINRYGKLTFISLDNFSLYPSETLYPADDLYPEEATEVVEKEGSNAIAYISSKYEDYAVSPIDGIIIRDEENADGGVTVGESTNPYVMSGNMLIMGKETAELTTIATKLLSKVSKVLYVPHETESIGLPYIEVGDTMLNANSADKELFVAKRVLTGISSVMDNFSATGNPKRENNNTVDSVEIRQLKGKTMKIFKDIDRIGVEVENLETSTKTRFEVSDGRITAEISRAQSAEASLQLSINGLRTEVKGKINGEEARSIFAVEIGKITLSANQISLEGYTTINRNFSIDYYGNVTLESGDSTARMTNSAFYIGNTTYGTAIKPASIGMEDRTNKRLVEVAGLYNNGGNTNIVIGQKSSSDATFGLEGYSVDAIDGTFVTLSTATLTCNAINGAPPITMANIGNYVVSDTSQITPTLTEYGNIDFNGSVNGASVTYVQENFARLSALEALEARVSALEK